MTTTSTQVGISGDEKPTSRVLRPPGGGSSNIFGGSDDGPRNAQRQKPISNVFGGEANEPPQRSKPQQQATHSNIFGEQQQESPSAPQQKQKSQGDEFPVYDVSVYAAQMTPQRRNITRASTHNPITGEVNPGCDDSPIENHKTGRRHVAITSSESVSTHNPITGEVNPGFENLDYIPDAQNTTTVSQKGRRNIGISSQNAGAYNPITGEPVGNAASNGDGDTKKVHTSSRVLNPPGGKSTALW